MGSRISGVTLQNGKVVDSKLAAMYQKAGNSLTAMILVKYVSWNYGRDARGNALHLIRLTNGQGLLRTTAECRALHLCD